MDSVKNPRGIIMRFSSCFNPTADEDGPFSHPPPPQPPPLNDVGQSLREKKTASRSISGFTKAVLYRTPFWKKLRSKRSKRESHRPNRTAPTQPQSRTEDENLPPSCKNPSNPDDETYCGDHSGRMSLFSSASSLHASSISSNSSSGSERAKAMSDGLDPSHASTNIRQHALKLVSISKEYDCRGLGFIILVCLVGLVFSGKVMAVVSCTSAWLFLAHRRGGGRPPVGAGQANDVVDSKEYKKMVIMEGFLERNVRTRVTR